MKNMQCQDVKNIVKCCPFFKKKQKECLTHGIVSSISCRVSTFWFCSPYIFIFFIWLYMKPSTAGRRTSCKWQEPPPPQPELKTPLVSSITKHPACCHSVPLPPLPPPPPLLPHFFLHMGRGGGGRPGWWWWWQDVDGVEGGHGEAVMALSSLCFLFEDVLCRFFFFLFLSCLCFFFLFWFRMEKILSLISANRSVTSSSFLLSVSCGPLCCCQRRWLT